MGKTKQLFDFARWSAWADKDLLKMFLISLPIGLTLVMEEAFFSGTNFLAGTLGADEQAAHQILFNAVGTSYLFNTGIAMAVAIIIGKHIGANNHSQILPTVKGGLIIILACTLPFALVIGLFDDQWINLFLNESLDSNQTTIFLAKSVILIAVVALFIDSCFLLLIETLHGMLDTTYPALCALVVYWLLVGPLAYWATHYSRLPFTGIWLCILLSSLMLVGLIALRVRAKTKGYSSKMSIL